MAYNHGIRVNEVPTQVARPLRGTAGLQVVFGTAPVNLAADPKAVTNKVILCESFEEASRVLGYSDDFKNYTLCQAMYASFKLMRISPVIFVNVLDPTKHKKPVAEVSVTVTNKQAVLDDIGVLLDSVSVKNNTSALTKGTDYITGFNADGKVVITLLPGGSAYAVTSLKVSAERLDPTMVTEAELIGGYDAGSGKYSGIELVRQVFPKYSMAPGILSAPGWSHSATVAAVLQSKCEKINGKFSCMTLLDIPATTVTKHTDVERAKATLGAISKFAIALWPMAKHAGKVLAYSAVYGALCARLDAENGDVPSVYPSNKVLGIDSACLADGSEVLLDEEQGNVLNAVGVVTIINQVGIRAWGNNTAAYPATKDPKDRWIAIRRCFSWYDNSFIIRFLDNVDDPANYRLVEHFIDNENINGNTLVADGKFAGVKFEFIKEDNPVSKIMDGEINFRERIAPYTPAEYIVNTISFDPRMIMDALGGGE